MSTRCCCSISGTRFSVVFFHETKIILSALCLILYFLGKVHKYLTFLSFFLQELTKREEKKKGSEAETTKKMIL
jgi:hypothetical protein